MPGLLDHVDHELAMRISQGVGVAIPTDNPRPGVMPPAGRPNVERSPALSMENTVKDSIKIRRVAVLAADGVDASEVQAVKKALEEKDAHVTLISKVPGSIKRLAQRAQVCNWSSKPTYPVSPNSMRR